MTSSAEGADLAACLPKAAELFGDAWRQLRARTQEGALPDGRVVVSAPAPVGSGGLGRHLQEILDALERRGAPKRCICRPMPAESLWSVAGLELRALRAVRRLPRASMSLRCWADNLEHDRQAKHLLQDCEHLIAFNGAALTQIKAARRAGFRSVQLVSATAHIELVQRQHARAWRQYPMERPWSSWLLPRSAAEYQLTDRIHVSSRYAWESFVDAGIGETKLVRFPLTPHPRFVPPKANGASQSTWDIVYAGSLSVAKGTPLLIDAMRRLRHPDIRLVLVGGWGSRQMRRFVEEACAHDSRISVCVGDPLPHMQSARLYVHPSYADGFSYGVAEALACGLPVVLSEDTGAKELIDKGINGLVVPTGDLDGLIEAIESAYRGELLGRGEMAPCA